MHYVGLVPEADLRQSDPLPKFLPAGGEIGGQVKTAGEVCLDGGKSGQIAFQPKAELQNQATGWLRKGCSFLDGGTVIRFP